MPAAPAAVLAAEDVEVEENNGAIAANQNVNQLFFLIPRIMRVIAFLLHTNTHTIRLDFRTFQCRANYLAQW